MRLASKSDPVLEDGESFDETRLTAPREGWTPVPTATPLPGTPAALSADAARPEPHVSPRSHAAAGGLGRWATRNDPSLKSFFPRPGDLRDGAAKAQRPGNPHLFPARRWQGWRGARPARCSKQRYPLAPSPPAPAGAFSSWPWPPSRQPPGPRRHRKLARRRPAGLIRAQRSVLSRAEPRCHGPAPARRRCPKPRCQTRPPR